MTELTRRDALTLAASTGLVALTGTLEAADDKKEEKKTDDRWRAWAVTEGEQTRLVVEGIYSEGGLGVVVVLKDGAPQGINPKILILDLTKATLPGIWPQILVPIPGWYVKAPYKKGQYDSIHIRYPDGSSVMIKTITDAGAGPK